MGKKNQLVLCDTTVLFLLLKGSEEVKKKYFSIGEENVCFSIITFAEAVAGSSKAEVKILKAFFQKHVLYPLDKQVSNIFTGLILTNNHRHSKWIPDASIAATALHYNVELFTLNRKDFDFIEGLRLYST